jgi:hypothetical protein
MVAPTGGNVRTNDGPVFVQTDMRIGYFDVVLYVINWMRAEHDVQSPAITHKHAYSVLVCVHHNTVNLI